ncbi:hypothetical protein GGR54DRAFT_654026 [Hypoxylon sp. NC1633]|nr:hypothetical protein GGR54DRAFT_654026 [Hypoxylon sp. NC1633]
MATREKIAREKIAREQIAREQMMADLGNARKEDFAKDDRPRPRPNPQPRQQPTSQFTTNPGAAGWRNAISQGLFEDDDYQAVKDLDTLDGGNAHRLNAAYNGTARGHVGHGAGLSRRPPSTSQDQSRYNPSQPGYWTKRSTRQPIEGFTESSLGGLVPPGAQTKRWEPKKKVQNGGSLPVPGATPRAGPQHATPITGAPTLVRGYTPTSVVTQPRPSVPQPQNAAATALKAPRQNVIAEQGKQQETKKHLLPHERRERFSPFQTTNPAPPAKSDATQVIESALGADRKAAKSDAAQANQPVTAGPLKSNTVQARNNSVHRAASFEPGQSIFRYDGVHITLVVGQDMFPSTGRVSLYKQQRGGIIVWELSTDDGRVMRGDIRLCLPPFHAGSSAHLRRLDNPDSEVCSSRIQFSTIKDAGEFVDKVKSNKRNQAGSREPIFSETLEDPRADGQDKQPADTSAPQEENAMGSKSRAEYVPQAELELQTHTKPHVESYPHTAPKPRPQSSASTLKDLNGLDAPKPSREASRAPEDPVGLENRPPPSATSTDNAQPGIDLITSQLDGEVSAAVGELSNIVALKAIVPGQGLSQGSLRILFVLTSADYKVIVDTSHNLVNLLGGTKGSPVPKLLEKITAQLVAVRLMQEADFRALERDEQRKACAVVYMNVLQGESKIVRSTRQMMDLRLSALPCPAEARKFNNYILSILGRPTRPARPVGPSNPSRPPSPANPAKASHESGEDTQTNDSGNAPKHVVPEMKQQVDTERQPKEEQHQEVQSSQARKLGQVPTLMVLDKIMASLTEGSPFMARDSRDKKPEKNTLASGWDRPASPASGWDRPASQASGWDRPADLASDRSNAHTPGSAWTRATSRAESHTSSALGGKDGSVQGPQFHGRGPSPSPRDRGHEMATSTDTTPRVSTAHSQRTFSPNGANAQLRQRTSTPTPGLDTSRWARPESSSTSTVSRDSNTTSMVSHEQLETGDLSSLSGLTGRLSGLRLEDLRPR